MPNHAQISAKSAANLHLGHQTINMTMRYTHLAPDHLAEAIKYNPVADM